MKKITLIFLITIYGLSVWGAGVSRLHCCDQFMPEHIATVQVVKEKCSSLTAMKDCCPSKFKSFKINGSHVVTNGISSIVKHFASLYSVAVVRGQILFALQSFLKTNNGYTPPLYNGVAVYIRNCVFLI